MARELGFAFFMLALVLLIVAVKGSLRTVDRIVVGRWHARPTCKKPAGE
jgi:uncharacterized membrane protein